MKICSLEFYVDPWVDDVFFGRVEYGKSSQILAGRGIDKFDDDCDMIMVIAAP